MNDRYLSFCQLQYYERRAASQGTHSTNPTNTSAHPDHWTPRTRCRSVAVPSKIVPPSASPGPHGRTHSSIIWARLSVRMISQRGRQVIGKID